jgi:hypothetical protein
MSDGGGIDVFALALKLTTDGAAEMESTLTNLNAKGQATAGSFTELIGTIAGVAAAFILLQKASAFLKDAVADAAEEEQVYTRMGVAVKNAGENFATAKPAIDSMLESLSENSTYRVDQLGGAFTRLVQLTGNVGGSMQKLAIVTDFAAGRNIDLESAANLVGRAMNGNAIMLNRMLGLHGDAAHALEILTERYHGNAEAIADTMGGAQDQANNAMHEFMEEIGGVIANEGGLKDATLSWRDVLKEATTWVRTHREAIGNVVLAFISTVQAIGEVVAAIRVPLVGAWILINTVIYAFIDVIMTVGPTFKLMVAEVLEGAVNLAQQVGAIVPGFNKLFGGAIASVKKTADQMKLDATTALKANDDALKDNLKSLYAYDETEKVVVNHIADHTTKTKLDTAALEKELEALTKLAAFQGQTVGQWLQEIADYDELTKRVNAHTMSVEEEAKARETLAKAAAQSPLLAGPQVLGMGTNGVNEVKALNDLQHTVTTSIINNGKVWAKNQKDAAAAYAHSAAGEWQKAADALADSIQQNVITDFIKVGSNIAGTIADSIGAGFSGGFKSALKTAEAGLGNIFSSMGKNMLLASAPLKALSAAMHNPITGGWAMAAAGLILMALGSTLGAIANGGGSGGGGSSSYSVAGAGTATNAAQITNITLSANAAAAGSKMTPVTPVQLTVIGSNDPTIHKPIIDLINNATGRGMVLHG